MFKKILYLAIFALILLVNGCGEKMTLVPKSDLENMGFYGNIKTITESVYYIGAECLEDTIGVLQRKEICNFDSRGNLLVRSYYDFREAYSVGTRYEYDSQGYLIKEIYTDLGRISLVDSVLCEYDFNGNQLVYDYFDSNGKLQKRILYGYDYGGDLFEKAYYDSGEKLIFKIQYEYDFYGNKIAEYYSDRDSLCENIKYLYSDEGRLKEIKTYNSAGLLLSRSECRNDTLGNMIELKLYLIKEGGQEVLSKITKYDIVYLSEDLIEKKINENDLGELGFYGNIESITELKYDSRFWKEKIGDLIEKKTRKFDSYGNMLGVQEYDSDGDLVENCKFIYDDSLKLLGVQKYDSDGDLVGNCKLICDDLGKCVQEYDSDGDLVENCKFIYDDSLKLLGVQKHDSDGDLVKEYKFDYDETDKLLVLNKCDFESGRKYKYKYIYDLANNLVMKEEYLSIDDDMYFYSGEYVYIYDSKGNLIKEMECTSKGDIICVNKYQYNSRGKLVRSVKYEPEIDDSEEFYSEYKYWYDIRGNLIEKRSYSSGRNLHKRYVYKYDENNNQLEKIVYDSDGELYRRYKYKYDEENNVIEKVSNFTKFGIELTRSITKYEITYRQ